MADLLKQYCKDHPEFLENLNSFPENIKQKIVKNLNNNKDKINFCSAIAEIQFGLLFNELGFELEYEREFFNKQTPDWSLSFNNSFAICEVYRLGKSKKDQNRSDFENLLREKIQKLPLCYLIKITFFNEYFDVNAYNIDNIFFVFSDWLYASDKAVGDKVIIQSNFEFEVCKINTKINHVCCSGKAYLIDYKSNKLIQFTHLKELNEVSKKLTKYNTLISDLNLPYFIAVSIDFVSGFNFIDIKEHFLGKEVEFNDYDTTIAKLPQFNHLGKEWSEMGIFYDNPQLSGLIIQDNNRFNLLLNPSKNQVIYNNINKIFLDNLRKIHV